MESQPIESIRAQNQRYLTEAFSALIAQAHEIPSADNAFLLEISIKLLDHAGNQKEVLVRMDGNVIEENQVVLTFTIREALTKKLILNYPGNFFKNDGDQYLENKENLTLIRVHDENFSDVGVSTAIVSQINDLRLAIFQQFATRLQIDRFFVLVHDSSNKENRHAPGWTSKRMQELGYSQSESSLFRKCVLLFRE